MTLIEILSLIVGALTSATSDEQSKAIAKWALLALRAWDIYGELSTQFKAVATRIQALKDGGWVIADVLAEYAVTEAQLDADFAALRGTN
jgi:hypothetical protein